MWRRRYSYPSRLGLAELIPPVHLHRPQLAAIYHPVSVAAVFGGVPVTVLLFRCAEPAGPDCFDTKLVKGSWTLDDLDGHQIRKMAAERAAAGGEEFT
jgi:hypothetical protein